MIGTGQKFEIALVLLWLAWTAILVCFRVSYGRLGRVLGVVESAEWHRLRFRQGTLDVLEPLKWYWRVRRFVRQGSPSNAQQVEIGTTMRQMRRLLELIEIGFVVLLVAIATATTHNIVMGAYVHVR